jgi:hypothetical protein
MNGLWYSFSTLLKWGIESLWAEWFVYVSIPLFANLAVSTIWTVARRSDYWKREYFMIFLPLLVYPLIALAGAIAWHVGVPVPPFNRPVPNDAAAWSVLILNILAIVLGLTMIFRMRHLRWFSTSVFLFIQWVLQGINLIVMMPIGGVWL